MANFLVLSRAKPKPEYGTTAIERFKELAEASKSSGSVNAEFGSIRTGQSVGSLLALQYFNNMADIEAVYEKILGMPAYEEMFATGNVELTGRAIARIHHRETGSSTDPKYIVLTKFESETEMLDEAKKVLGIFMANGGMSCGYATLIGGSSVGDHLMGVRYPSMEAIQKAYDVARGSADFQSALSKVKVQFRNIIRLA